MRTLLLTALLLLPTPVPPDQHGRQSFDVQAHRGGLGLRVENTLASFGNALQLGVSTLELDIQITADGAAVVTHDRRINPAKCSGDFGGRFIKDLTLAQVRTMDCGSQAQSGFPASARGADQLRLPADRPARGVAVAGRNRHRRLRRGSHRGVRPENTLPAFEYALANPAISTLELDTGVTADGHLVVIHDRAINGSHCQGQYVGRLVHELTLAQIKTLDCGSLTLPEFPARSRCPARAFPAWRRCSTSCGAAGATTSG
ncbi:MAG TPA: glycerophosphodiester phosphodiesterase family protein [Candidatus Limnocylindrales bacterium]|nr:glycerophosphodiester phosphodiesterase family protein [Candidatus Limnocylindrales bacterium]